MNITVKKPKDLLSGLLFVALGAMIFYLSLAYNMGTARQMGPGYFPRVLALIVVGLGLLLVARSVRGTYDAVQRINFRASVPILGGSLLFALLVRPAGLLVAIVVMVVVGSLASKEFRLLPTLLLAAVLAAGSAFLFAYMLGQPLPVLGYWFR